MVQNTNIPVYKPQKLKTDKSVGQIPLDAKYYRWYMGLGERTNDIILSNVVHLFLLKDPFTCITDIYLTMYRCTIFFVDIDIS